PVSQPDPRDLAQRRIRLLGRRGVDARADAALLRIAAQRGHLLFRFHVAAAVPDELIDSRQISLTRIVKSCSKARETKQVVRLRSRVSRKAGGGGTRSPEPVRAPQHNGANYTAKQPAHPAGNGGADSSPA